ncbi:MAG: hypothetical protein SFW63_05290 [Alphaproteobacteria bacterium]|nr:hypothetical protein [Alphaproteobacteria bacterium]
MFGLFKQSAVKKSAQASFQQATSRAEFIPYFHHYDRNTIATCNGELMQTIQITQNQRGLNYENDTDGNITLRDVLRQALSTSVSSDHFAFWVHTLRRRDPLHHETTHPHPFARYAHDLWREKNHWDYHYHNEVYLTILREGQSCPLFQPNHLHQVLTTQKNRDYRARFLEAMYRDLDSTTQRILNVIRSRYNARVIGITERLPGNLIDGIFEPIFFSEPSEFLGLLLNLSHQPFPLAENRIANDIHTHGLSFGYNALESRSPAGKKRFAGLLTIKHYHETTVEALDHVLQMSAEMIISQSFNFKPCKEALKVLRPQKELFDISGDHYSARVSGLQDIWQQQQMRPTDFADVQTTITVITDDHRVLDDEIKKVQQRLGQLGVATVREDIRMEESFWASLPGNFEFIRRQDTLSRRHVAGFARLNRFPAGQATGNHWGDAVTILPTLVGSPYYFNFHHQDNGHTVMLDYNSFQDSSGKVLTNFLLGECMKWPCRIVIFDSNKSAALWCQTTGAAYYDASPASPLPLNPLSLAADARNQSFLLAWINELLDGHLTQHEADREAIRQALVDVQSQPHPSLQKVLRHLENHQPSLALRLSREMGAMTSCHFGEEDISGSLGFAGIQMDALCQQGKQGVVVFAYLLHQIINQLDGSPCIIVLHEADRLLEHPFFARRLDSLLEMLTQHNAMLLATLSTPDIAAETHTMTTLMKTAATRLYLPDEISRDYASEPLGISEADARSLSRMKREHGHFLVRHNNESIQLATNLSDLHDVRAILANDIKNLINAGGPFAKRQGAHAS